MAMQDDIKTWPLAVLGFFGVTVVIVIILAMMVLYHHTEAQLEYERTVRVPFVDLENALAIQQGHLLQYQRTEDEERDGVTKPVYRIPIDRAMEIVLREWRSGVLPGPPPKPQASVPAAEKSPVSGKTSDGRSGK